MHLVFYAKPITTRGSGFKKYNLAARQLSTMFKKYGKKEQLMNSLRFLKTLMLAFVIALAFVVNTASADTVTCPNGQVTYENPCIAFIEKGDELRFTYNANASLRFKVNNLSCYRQATLGLRIGNQELAPKMISAKDYKVFDIEIAHFRMGIIMNKSSRRSSIIRVEISQNKSALPLPL